jgi:hypothetical protein
MAWDLTDIADAVAGGLMRRAAADDAEQAVYSIDALDELGLHPILHESLRAGGYGVWPEQRYPSDRAPRRSKSQGQRCDVVLTREVEQTLVDPDAEQTLFAPPDSLPLEAAFWLEIKTVSQFTTEGPFAHYGKEMLNPVSRDLRKLAADRLIFHAGLLLVLFTADEQTARHDLNAWLLRITRKGYPVAPAAERHHPITDRLGNGHLAVALYAVRRL